MAFDIINYLISLTCTLFNYKIRSGKTKETGQVPIMPLIEGKERIRYLEIPLTPASS